MIRKSVIIISAVTALSSGILLGSGRDLRTTSAYFTDQEFHTNIYTFGDVTADGTETEWKPEKAVHLLPNESAPKNPVLVNTGDNAAIGFIVLDSPLLRDALTADENGNRTEQTEIETWIFQDSEGSEGFDGNWILTETSYADEAHQRTADPAKAVFIRRVFGYRDSLPGRKGEEYAETSPLFSSIKAFNYVEGSVKETELRGIDIYFLAVQADSLQLDNGSVTAEVTTKNMSASVLESIWKILGANADFAAIPEADQTHRLDLSGAHRNEKGGTPE